MQVSRPRDQSSVSSFNIRTKNLEDGLRSSGATVPELKVKAVVYTKSLFRSIKEERSWTLDEEKSFETQ